MPCIFTDMGINHLFGSVEDQSSSPHDEQYEPIRGAPHEVSVCDIRESKSNDDNPVEYRVAKKRQFTVDTQSSPWNLDLTPRAGGAPYTKTEESASNLDVAMCRSLESSNTPLAIWDISCKTKYLPRMHSLKTLADKNGANTDGVVHPIMKFSDVDIPMKEFEEHVEKDFSSWAKTIQGFSAFASPVGLAKTQFVNQEGEKMINLAFSPNAWNENGYRMCVSHKKKPNVNFFKCEFRCCKDSWCELPCCAGLFKARHPVM